MARSDETLMQLPETKAASKGVKHKLDTLLREAHSLRQVEKRLKEVKSEIIELLQQQDLSTDDGKLGCRAGELCCIARFQRGRASFNRELAVEAGITPEQIESSMKQGPDYWVLELVSLGEPD
jgi:hypothetical protein